MTTKKFTKLDDILEFKYAETCPYVWPYSEKDGVNWNDLLQSGYFYDNLQEFYSCHPILRLLNYEAYTEKDLFEYDADSRDNSDLDYEDDPEANDEYEQEKERLLSLAAQFETWPFETVVCSYIFYDLSTDIKNSRSISFFTWSSVMAHLTSPLIGPELLAMIKRNGFFELTSEQAIKGTLYFLRERVTYLGLFEKPDTESIILRILECLQVEPEVAQDLTTQTLKTQNFCSILTFLENYSFPNKVAYQE